MTDISLRLLADAANAQGAFKDFGSAVTAASAVVQQFAKESIKAYADAERVQRQLKLAAGEWTGALNEQAEAMKRKFAVDDDEIRHMDVLLLRYGAAPAALEKTTEAVLNYAAVTGNDAASATQALVRAVESGTGSIKSMGLHFKTTGQFSTDLANAVEALNKKFGGAAAADADSLDGRMRKVSLATDDLKKAFGGLFNELEQRTGVLDKIATTVDRMSESLKSQGWKALLDPRFGFETATERAGLLPLPPERKDWSIPGALPGASENDHAVGKTKTAGAETREQEDARLFQQIELHKRLIKEDRDFEEKQTELERKSAQERADDSSKDLQAQLLAQAKADEKTLDDLTKLHEAEFAADERQQKKVEALHEKEMAEQDRRFKQQEAMWKQAGDRIGAALVDAIGQQLQRLAEGGEVDPAEMAGDAVEAVLTIVGGIIGTVYGAPQLGGAIGGLAGGLAKAGIKAAGGKKHHDGGWIERYHEGGWPGGPVMNDERHALLQTGERVLSRREVNAMGGPQGVDSAARGGGRSTVVNISAMDSESMADSFGRRGGRGFFNAIRVGRGELAPLFR